MADNNSANLVWNIANILRGTYKPAQYGSVILPFTILRRLDCVLEATKSAVLSEAEARKHLGIPLDAFLKSASGHSFFNTSKLTFSDFIGDPSNIKANIEDYVKNFSSTTRDIFEHFEFAKTLEKLDNADLLYHVAKDFAAIDLHPEIVNNIEMGLMFEDLIRRFAAASNETAGEHFTPREVIKLMVQLLLNYDDSVLQKEGIVRKIYDPTAGTGGMLTVAQEHLKTLNPSATLVAFAQEINDESYAICKADLLIKGQDISKVRLGDTLTDDQLAGEFFDFVLSNPPFGVEWKKIQEKIRKEHNNKGFEGRYGAGLPRVSDGSMLFLQHVVSKLRPRSDGGGRAGIVLNGSPMFTGSAGTGESNIRRHLLENDLVEAIIALPTDMFYNTGIATYVWILSNNKVERQPARAGKVQLIDGRRLWKPMTRPQGDKRKKLSPQNISDIVKLYGEFRESSLSRILSNDDFAYNEFIIDRPLRRRFEFSENVLSDIITQKKVAALGSDSVHLVEKSLRALSARLPSQNFQDLYSHLSKEFRTAGLRLTPAQTRNILLSFGVPDASAPGCTLANGTFIPDPALRDTFQVRIKDDPQTIFESEVLRFAPDAYCDFSTPKRGYEINFNHHFAVLSEEIDVIGIAKSLKAQKHAYDEIVKGLLIGNQV